jgi:hypothetical protein
MMRTTLQDYATQIDALTRLEIGEPEVDGYGDNLHGSPEQEACSRLYSIWGELRRILWSPAFRDQARQLEQRCHESITAICTAHGLIQGGTPPRFPSFTDSAGNHHRAIY